MKRSLTLALVFAVLAAFAGLSAVQGAPQKAKQKSPTTSSGTTTAPTTAPTAAEKTTVNTSKSNTFRVATQVMTGKVVSVDKVANTFTVVANGKQVTFFANKLMLPDVGKMMDIHYIQPTPGGPMEATTIQPTPGGTFAVTNLNSSRSNISRSGNTSATSKAINEPPPQKPTQAVGQPELPEVALGGPDTASARMMNGSQGMQAAIERGVTHDADRGGKDSQKVITGTVTRMHPDLMKFTVTANGKELTFDAKNLTTSPSVGDVIDVNYTQAPGGPMVATATTIRGSKSNSSSYRKGAPTSASPVPTPGPVGATTVRGSKSNASERQNAPTSTSPDPTPVGQTTVNSSRSNNYRVATPGNVMTGKVLSVNKVANTFTIMTKGNQVIFTLKKGEALPQVGKILDITYIPAPPGRPATPGGPFTVTNLNSSRSNIY